MIEYPLNKPKEHGYYQAVYVLNNIERQKPIMWNGIKGSFPNGDTAIVKFFDENTHSLFYCECLRK